MPDDFRLVGLGSSTGCVIFHAPPSFFSVVASPLPVLTFTSSILSACSAGEDLLASWRRSAPPSGFFEVTK